MKENEQEIEEDIDDLDEGTLLLTSKHVIFDGFIRDYTVFGEKHHQLKQISAKFNVESTYIMRDVRGPFYFDVMNLPPLKNGFYVKGVALTKRIANCSKLEDKINIVYNMNISDEKNGNPICNYGPFNPLQDY